MDDIIIKKNKFEATIKTIFYESLLSAIHKNRKDITIYDEFRRIVENDDGFIGYDSYDDIENLKYDEDTIMVGKHVAVGAYALLRNTTGSNGVAIRYNALFPSDPFKNDTDIVFRDECRHNDLYDNLCYYWILNSKLSLHIKPNFKLPINYENLFVFCYYLNYHDKDGFINIKKHIRDYKNNNHTYSPIGATIISKANYHIKQNFIHQLLKCGYQPTINDIDLSISELYNTIYKKHVMMVMVIFRDNILVRDIHKYIISLLIEMWNKDYALL